MTQTTKTLRNRAAIIALSAAIATMPVAQTAQANDVGKLLLGGAVGLVAGKAIANQRAQAAQLQAQQNFIIQQQQQQARQRAAAQPRSVAQPATQTRRAAAPAADSFAGQRTALTQEFLNDLGFDAGPIDGIPGSQTRRAIAEFQAVNGFSATGRLTPSQFDVLKKERDLALTAANTQAPANVTAPTSAPTRAPSDVPVVAPLALENPALMKLTFSNEVGALLKGEPESLTVSVDGQRLAERMFTAYHRSFAQQCGAFLGANVTEVTSSVDGGAIPIRSDFAGLFAYLDAKTDGGLLGTGISDATALQTSVDTDMSLVLQINGCASADTRTFERSLLKAVTV